MRALSTIAVGLALLASAQSDDKKFDKDKLIGVWKVVKSEGVPPGATVEFLKDNKFKVAFEANGKKFNAEGTYKVEGDKLLTELKLGDKVEKDSATIKVLTAEKLTLVDKDGMEDTLERAKK